MAKARREPTTIVYADQRPAREVEIIKPFVAQGDNGEQLHWGNRYRVSADLAAILVHSGRAIDVSTGERYDALPGFVNAPDVKATPAPVVGPVSNKTVRVRVLHPFSIQMEDGKVIGPGEEHQVSVDLLRTLGRRVALIDAVERQERKVMPEGDPHPVRINAGGPGCGIWSVGLDRHVDHGEEVVVPDGEAQILIAMGRAVSLIPEVPSPAAIEMGELIAGDDQEKAGRVATLVTKILKGRIR